MVRAVALKGMLRETGESPFVGARCKRLVEVSGLKEAGMRLAEA